MHATARRPLWVRVGAGLLATILFLTNTVYPWISLLPAPPIVVAQESPLTASDSAEATPAASVATPAPSPLDPLDQLENEILLSTNSAETVLPEEPPESTPSASSAPTPEVPPEDQILPPSSTPSPSESLINNSTDIRDDGSTDLPAQAGAEQSGRLPPPLDPFLISLKYPFVGTYPISYGFGEVSGSSYVRLMQSIFDVDAHDGLDFAMPEGTSVLATGPGEVIYAGNGLYGVTVVIRHSWGSSYYGHLSQTSVTVGDKVTTGQEIGLSGNTGISTAPHLHFGIRPNHHDPYNGYRGMIDPLPYLNNSILGATTIKHDLIHLPYKTLGNTDNTLSIPILASSSASLTYTLTNPKGESKLVYPTIYNFGTGDTAILQKPTPFLPGEYTLTVTSLDGETDSITFSWGVVTLNTNQSRYTLGDTAKLALAVLDETGEMVCDADLILTITTPSGEVSILTTDNQRVARNLEVCKSKALTLTPDYEASLKTSEVGTHTLSLTAITPKHTFTITDTFEVVESLPYTLERLTATRIFPGNIYPVILKVTAYEDLNSKLVEQVPAGFSTTPAGSSDFAPWVSPEDLNTLSSNPYSRVEKENIQSLSWDLILKGGQSTILGYTYDAPDESPTLYTLGPINFAGITESRSWNIAIDSVDPNIGYFSPPPTWTTVGDSNISLPYPDPRNGDLVLATVAVRPSTVTIATPAGWTSLGSWSGGDGGAEGADTGSVSQYWFYQTADGSEGSSTETFTKTGTASVITGNIMQIRSGTGTYDLAAGGYSINADATNWNGTLDTDIGTRDGDLIILTGAQNGDLSNTSAWNITATNLVTKSTVNEHGEFTNATGNDIEVGLATTQVWEGNNTTTPAITLTQSAAASGVVTAIRIRQGSGTNRSDTWVRAAGRQVAGTTSVAPSYPEHDYGDLLLLFVGSRASADNTPNTPTGWTSLGSYNGGVGTFGADAGNARSTVFYREATARLTGTVSVSITSGNTAIGQIVSIHRDDAESWTLDSDGGTDTSAGTGWSVTGSGIDLDSASGGDILLVGNSINTDAYTYSSYNLSASGITFGDVTETAEFTTTGGNDMALTVGNGRISSGSASNVAPTFTMTSSGSGTNAPAGSSVFVKVSSTSNTTSTKAVGFFTPPATWTSAGNANLSLTYPDPRDGDLMVAITAIRPAASTVDTPAGWTLVDSRTGTDGGAEAADTGSVGIYVFTKTADGTEGTGTLAFTETGTTSVWIGNIMKVRSGTGTYSVSASGYSLNGDTVTWGSTLGADIGLTNGDLVLLAAAQNGDLGNTSAWDISATDITQKSTFNEHGEFVSTTGNDIEVGLASGIIWGGTNSATPTLTITQSAAASGVVSAIRIREDTGTQRADTWVRSASPQVVSTTTTLNLVYPEHEIGDMFVMFISTRGTSDPTLLAPYGWTSLGSYNGGAGTFGADAGNARTTAYYREATSRRWGTQAVALTSADVAIGQILSVHTKNIDTWTIDSDGGTDTSAGTDWSTTGSGIDLNSGDGGDLLIVGSAINTDAYTYSAHALSASGITFGEVTQTVTYNTTSGNDANLNIVMSRVTSGTGSGAPTLTMTASGSTANAPAGSSLFVKIVGISSVMTVSGTANGNDGATVKVALGASAQAQTTTISSGTWTISDVTRPSVGTVATVWVDNVADNLESTAVTIYNNAPISGLVLNNNVITLGSNQDQSISLTNLNSYDCTEDEDIMHQAASSHLKVEGDSCAGSTTNSYTSEKISTLSGDTLALGTSETLTTYDLENAGTITVTGNGTLNVSHDWANTGTFTAGTSTVNLTGADSSTQTISGSTTFNNLVASTSSNSLGRTLRYTTGTTTTVSGTWTMTGTSTKTLTLESSAASTWIIAPTAASVSYVSVSYSKNHGADFCASNTIDGGNNIRWRNTCEPSAQSFQRKTFYDDQNSRYWRFSTDGTDIDAEYSSDGTSWNAGTTLPYNTNDFSVEYKSIGGTEYVWTAVANNYDIVVRQGVLGASSVTWDSDVATIFNGSNGADSYQNPYLSLDNPTSGNPKIWVSATKYTEAGHIISTRRTSTTADTDPSAWTYDTANQITEASNNSKIYSILNALSGSVMYITFVVNTSLRGCVWDNTNSIWEDSSGNSCLAGDGGTWYNASWNYRTKLTVDASKVDSDLTDYPLYINLNDLPTNFHTNVNQTDARDVRVTKADGTTELPREVVFYDSSTDTGELYVNYTGTLSGTTNTDIYVYYGNSGASDYATTDTYGRNNVWDSNYVSVYHFNETSGQHIDSTGNHDSSSVTVNQQGADIGKVFKADDYIAGSKIVMNDHDDYSINTTNQLTAEAWVKYDTISASIESLNKGYGSNYEWSLRVNTDGSVIANAFTAAGGDYMLAQSGVSEVTTATWYHLAMTFNFDSPSAEVFKNGVSKATSTSTSGSYANGSSSFNIGRRADNSRDTDGVIDEVRISNTARSDVWLSTQYNNQNDPSTFFNSFGAQEVLFGYYDTIDTTTSDTQDYFSSISDNSSIIHLTYVDNETTDQISYRKYISGSWSAATLVADAASDNDTYPTISLDTTNSDLYILWIDGATSDVIYSSCDTTTGCDAASEWATEITHDSTGSNVQLSSNISAAGKIFFVYSDGTTLVWDDVTIGGSNTAPNSPTSLTQKTTGDVTLTTGAWHNSTSIKFTATATDTDNPDTLQLCIEIDQLGTSFSNTEDSCGTGVSYTGSGVTITHTITVTDAQEYHWQARVKDAGGLYSSWVSYDVNAESARDVGVDTTAPTGGTVYDGTGVGVDSTFATSSLSALSANWDSFNTDVSGLLRYDYSIGTSAGATDIKSWTDNTTSTTVTATGLTLQTSQIYYVNVRAVDNAGNVQSAVSSNGQLVSPSISFAITPASATFNNLNAGNSYADTEVATLTTSTNAYNGYVIRAFTTDLLKSLGGTHQIANFSAGTYASPATWAGSETGFGYTSSDTSIQGSDKFGSGTLYAPFSQTGPGDIVADHTSTVAGTSISNEAFNITYKVKVPASQAATNYTSTVVYTATAQY